MAAQSGNGVFHSALQELDAEIRAFGDYLQPSVAERSAAASVYHQLKDMILQTCGTEMIVDLIGSRAVGTEEPISDLDINIRLRVHSPEAESLESTAIRLDGLDKRLRRRPFCDDIALHAFLGKARTPIIVGTHRLSGLEFQIQSSTSVYDSLETAKAFVAEYPTVGLLLKLFKQMLSMRGLTKGSFGGITSYPLLNMIVAGLKLAGAEIHSHDVASQFLCILKFWSEFGFDREKITFQASDQHGDPLKYATDPFSAVPRIVSKKKDPVTNVYLTFEDPADFMNNLGATTYRINRVKACFIAAHQQLEHAMSDWPEICDRSVSAENPRSLLAHCLGGDYTSFEESRLQLRKYAELVTAT